MRGLSQCLLLVSATTGFLTGVAGRTISLREFGDMSQNAASAGIHKRVVTTPKLPAAAPKSPAPLACQPCAASKKTSRRGNCCPGGVTVEDDGWADDLPATTMQSSTQAGSPEKAESDARILLAAKKKDVTSPSWTLHYGPEAAANFQIGPVGQDIVSALGPALKKHGVNVAAKASNFIVRPEGHTDGRPVLAAYYLPNAIIITDVFKSSDANPAASRLYPSELMYQGAQHAASHPVVVAHHNVANTATEAFATEALGGAVSVTVTLASNRDLFLRLVGSDNGRVTQRMLNDHPTWFGGHNIIAIEVLKPAGSTLPHIIFVIG